jgi:hypothetical protein
MPEQLPYVPAYGSISKVLDKIKAAGTPDRFTQDFLSTKLGMKGGSPRAVIPFLKRVGFLASDGSPTDVYKRFRNPAQSGRAAAQALKTGYRALYEMNEYAHDLNDKDLAGLIVQATGLEPNSSTTKIILGSFKALKQIATFDEPIPERPTDQSAEQKDEPENAPPSRPPLAAELGLSYTINLHLPPTSDIAVFNAIFKSIREHLLR